MLIAQITDFHVVVPGSLVYGRVDTAAMLAQAVEALNRLDPQPDLVIGSGDLVQNGLDAEYDALVAILADLKAPFAPVPGNHDRRAGLARTFRSSTLGLGAVLDSGSYFQYSLDVPGLRIIVLDTVTEGFDHASFDEDRAAWLRQALVVDTPSLIVTHHPPFATGIPWMDPSSYDWVEPIERAIVGSPTPVAGLISGHIHRAIHTRFAGVPASSCPSTAHQVALDFQSEAPRLSHEAPGFQLHRWNGRNLVTYTVSFARFGTDFSPSEGGPDV